MGLMNLLKSKKAPESLIDEFVRLTATVTSREADFATQTYLHFAAASDTYGTDIMLLSGPTAYRVGAIVLSDEDAQKIAAKRSPEFYGLRLFNLWLRCQQDDSGAAGGIFRGLCGQLFKIREFYYAGLPDKSRFRIQRVSTVGSHERDQFQNLKNFMLLRELANECTPQHLVGCILGYADTYLMQVVGQTTRAEDYVPLITDERLAKLDVIRGAFVRDGSGNPESGKLVEAGRVEGAKVFRETLKRILA